MDNRLACRESSRIRRSSSSGTNFRRGFPRACFAYYPTGKVNVMVKGPGRTGQRRVCLRRLFSRTRGFRRPAGRLIIPDDDRVGAPAIAVLSYAYSQKALWRCGKGAPGQSILINNIFRSSVAGVAPPGFFGVDPAAAPDFYVSATRQPPAWRLRGGANDAKQYLAQKLLLARK